MNRISLDKAFLNNVSAMTQECFFKEFYGEGD